MENQYLRPMVRCGCLVSGGVTIVDLERVPGLTASHRDKLIRLLDPPRDMQDAQYSEGFRDGYEEGYEHGYSAAMDEVGL
jgi:hypothetical protein